MFKQESIQITCEDNMELMKRYEDNHFDLAIVDPPYGIGEDGLKNHSREKKAKPRLYTPKEWDNNSPDLDYFKELIRVSKNQIIWGANHFISKVQNSDSSSWVVWDKQNGENDFADCELAYTSFKSSVRKFTFRWAGMLQGDMKNKQQRIHPTEKPYALYQWLLSNYAKEGDKILDTHLGSGSIAIALDSVNKIEKMNLSLVACELDEEYFDKSVQRIKEKTSWQSLF